MIDDYDDMGAMDDTAVNDDDEDMFLGGNSQQDASFSQFPRGYQCFPICNASPLIYPAKELTLNWIKKFCDKNPAFSFCSLGVYPKSYLRNHVRLCITQYLNLP